MDVSVEVLGSARVFHLKNDGHHRLFFFFSTGYCDRKNCFYGFQFPFSQVVLVTHHSELPREQSQAASLPGHSTY